MTEVSFYQSRHILPVSSHPSASFEVQTVLYLRDLSICFLLKSLGPPCDAFIRIYKVCNLACVGFLIF